MQSYVSDLLARERIAEFRRDADRDRLARWYRAARTSRRHRRASARQWVLVEHQPRRATA